MIFEIGFARSMSRSGVFSSEGAAVDPGRRRSSRSPVRHYQKLRRRCLTGEGAFQFGGRWNSAGVRLVYLCGFPSMVVLEALAHRSREAKEPRSQGAKRFGILRLNLDSLPETMSNRDYLTSRLLGFEALAKCVIEKWRGRLRNTRAIGNR